MRQLRFEHRVLNVTRNDLPIRIRTKLDHPHQIELRVVHDLPDLLVGQDRGPPLGKLTQDKRLLPGTENYSSDSRFFRRVRMESRGFEIDGDGTGGEDGTVSCGGIHDIPEGLPSGTATTGIFVG